MHTTGYGDDLQNNDFLPVALLVHKGKQYPGGIARLLTPWLAREYVGFVCILLIEGEAAV